MSLVTQAFADEPLSPRIDSSIIRGLEFLARQQKQDGSFQQDGPKIALTALSVMAFEASGHTPGDGRYGQTVRRGIDYLINQFPDDGYVGKVDGSRMYGQGIITLALAESYGVERDATRRQKIRQILAKAVGVIITAQNVKKDQAQAGGWRYEPSSGDSDLSLSGWCALALRACNNVGVSTGKDSVDRARTYVLKCYREDRKGFGYQPGHEPSSAMTGVGVLNLCLMDAGDKPQVAQGAKFMVEHKVNVDTRFAYYSFYYTTHAAFQVGGDTWNQVWQDNSQAILALQDDDGGWKQSRSGEENGRTFATAMSVLSLSAPLRLMPVHQR